MSAEIQIARLEQQLDSHNSRISSLHKRLGEVQVTMTDEHAKVSVLANEVEEARTDIAEMRKETRESLSSLKKDTNESLGSIKRENSEASKALQTSFDKKFETLTGAVRWGTGALLAAIGVMIPLLLNLH